MGTHQRYVVRKYLNAICYAGEKDGFMQWTYDISKAEKFTKKKADEFISKIYRENNLTLYKAEI